MHTACLSRFQHNFFDQFYALYTENTTCRSCFHVLCCHDLQPACRLDPEDDSIWRGTMSERVFSLPLQKNGARGKSIAITIIQNFDPNVRKFEKGSAAQRCTTTLWRHHWVLKYQPDFDNSCPRLVSTL